MFTDRVAVTDNRPVGLNKSNLTLTLALALTHRNLTA